ncbi:putative membrane protein [Pontibacter ummariensis]|uniref:Putative membrane protein n=1 Tax=Pontibacter ummariensis TaxID=1610492 RepID=A0A239JTF6_9BACT|nr:bestrophin family ion channel [Pontibacter ummariensis]PRY07423.1 putative membrane protein [Pontibacter ummariensis]SNT09075.1 putative membrane protein [Pontibacter ummariensis]
MLIEKRIPFRYIFRKIKWDVFRVLLFSIAFHLLKLFVADYLPIIPFQLPTILGTSISLLLAFRVNQSYDRWWEARKVWGAIVNDSRSLVLQLKTFIRDDYQRFGEEAVTRMSFRQIAWCYCLGQSLRGLEPIAEKQQEHLQEEEIGFLRTQNNKPYGLLMLHMNDLKELHEREVINAYQQVQLDNTIVRLCDSMGKAERINNTVFPVTYSLFVHFFIYLFLIILSLALVETVGIFEIPILVLIASTFFLIEKTARHMQDPFRNKPTDTSVTAIARTIEINIKQVLQKPEVPKPLTPEAFYLM